MANEIPAGITLQSSNDDAHKLFGDILNSENQIELNGKTFANPWCSVDEYIPQDGYIYGYARNGLDEKFMIELYKAVSKIDPDCSISSMEDSTMCQGFDTHMDISNHTFRCIWIDTTRLANKHEIDLEKLVEEQDYKLKDKLEELADKELGKFMNLDSKDDPSKLYGSMTTIVNFQ